MAEFRFIYQPVDDLHAAVQFYTEVLGGEERWRDGELSVGMTMPGQGSQIMLSLSGKPAGPMYRVANLDEWIIEHPDVPVAVARDAAGAGSVAGFRDPAGNLFYVFDQPAG
jgi:catechol 2,3-dioxygenase-like lactoylglutathione lyase family enzyme